MSILIFSKPGDFHTIAVSRAFDILGVECKTIFLSDVPQCGTISYSSGDGNSCVSIRMDNQTIDPGNFETIWFRRMRRAVPRTGLHPGDEESVMRNWRSMFRSIEHLTSLIHRSAA